MELGMGGEGSLYICAQHRLFSLLHDLTRVVYKPELQSKRFHGGHSQKGESQSLLQEYHNECRLCSAV